MAALQSLGMGRTLALTATGLLALAVWSGNRATAQPPAPPMVPQADAPRAAATEAAVEPSEQRQAQEVLPELIYLPDEQGRLQPVLNLPLDEFRKLWEGREGVGLLPPPALVEELSIRGAAHGRHAELEVAIIIETSRSGWVRVPLRMPEGVLHGPEQYTGEGEFRLDVAGEAGGWIAWFKSDAPARHGLRLPMRVPLEDQGTDTRLHLTLPKAKRSRLALTLPPEVAVRSAVGLGEVESQPVAEGTPATLATIEGLRSALDLSWSAAGIEPEMRPRFAVQTNLAATIRREGIDLVIGLRLRRLEQTLESLRIQLPRGFLLDATDHDQWQATQLSSPGTDEPSGPLYEIALREPAAGAVALELAASREGLLGPLEATVDLGGLELFAAQQQAGFLMLAADDELEVALPAVPGLEAIEPGALPESLARAETRAAYIFQRLPSSLPVEVRERATQVAVDPGHRLEVGANQALLDSRYRLRIEGGRGVELPLDYQGWQITQVEPAEVFEPAAAGKPPGAPLKLRLTAGASGPLEVRVRAQRDLPPPDEPFEVPLPRPLVESVGPAPVAVLADDNVELRPEPSAMRGLTPAARGAPWDLPRRQQPPLWYQLAPGEPGLLAATRTVRAREITNDVALRVSVAPESARVEETINYEVRHEPVAEVALLVPPTVLAAGNLEIQLEGKPLTWSAPSTAPGDSGPLRLALPLGEPKIGTFRLSLSYSVSLEKLAPGTSVAVSVPLAMPGDEAARCELRVAPQAGIEVQLGRQPEVRPANRAGGPSDASGELRLVATGPVASLALVANLKDLAVLRETIVERAFIQSWLAGGARQDRVVLKLASGQPLVRLGLPAGCVRDDVEVFVNQAAVATRTTVDGLLEIPLGQPGTGRQRYVIELLYRFTGLVPARGPISLETIRLERDIWVRRVYWQLVLSGDQHVLESPADYSHEFRWSQAGLLWRRLPLLDQTDLETWADAPQRESLPTGNNRYLFSRHGDLAPLVVRSESRAGLVLLSSGGALVIGLLLIYLAPLRRPIVLLVAGMLLAACGALAPEPTLLFVQAGALGLALALVALALERRAARRQPRGPAPRSGSSIVARGSLEGPARSQTAPGSTRSPAAVTFDAPEVT